MARERHPRTPRRPALYYAVAAAAALVAALSLAGLARGAALPPDPPAAEARPDWAVRPSPADVSRYYPPRARRDGVEGRAVLECGVQPSGALSGCTVVEESPAGRGFGRAAVEMAGSSFRMTGRADTAAPDPTVRIPVVFDLADPPPRREREGENDSPWRWAWVFAFLIGLSKLMGKARREQLLLQAGRLTRRALQARGAPALPGPAEPHKPVSAPTAPSIVTEGRRAWPWARDRR